MTCDINNQGQFNMPASESTSNETTNILCATMDTSVIQQEQITLRGASLRCLFAVNDANDPSISLAFGQANFTFPGKCLLSQNG